ncbi:AraC-like DNA-binding protein [Pedobacter cryoconitis]|uniref:AraC-like DNA-binding protein n=1 Tax=Pedobacter cryoconitis TaxID=188932 RepID=A0A7W8ZID4_9SPHI|nr:AraC family transcriptional regulator [Pedobacter cryoconitis]MBB5634460.1 AraC-like DNA-binding protein [Pedobacter cryoconitis]
MVRDNLYEPFELVLKDILDECPRGPHVHSFFELVYIVSGTGKQSINEIKFNYLPNHLFLLTPGDSHYFEISKPTQFFFIRFNNNYIQSQNKQNEFVQQLEMILRNAANDPGCIIKNQSDKIVLKPMMEAVITEHQGNDLFHKELITSYIRTLLTIVARNISQYMPEKIVQHSDEKVVSILQYIQTNICNPDHLRIGHISKEFGISETYLSRYFKKHVNEGIQDYIINYKLGLIDNRLLHSNKRISEIADEFGFTDKSHLSRIFKKYRGVNPSDFKKGLTASVH